LDVQMPGMSGFELAELMRGTDKTRHIPIVFVSAAGKESNYAFKGYETGAVDFLYKPLDIDAVRGKVNVFVELFRHRQEIQRQVQALEKSRQAQALLVQQLQSAQGDLQSAIRMRDDFMAMVANELQTPLNTLFLEVQMRKQALERGNTGRLNQADLQKMVDSDERQVKSMVGLIDDMLDVSRIRSRQLALRPRELELSTLLSRVVAQLHPQAAAAGSVVRLQAGQPVTGQWDAFRIEQVMVRLLSRALRFGQARPVDISLTPVDGGARIDVRDQGPGIALADQAHIFDHFEHDAQHPAAGLYICQQLVLAHGGTLGVHSQPGQGALFTLTLPLTPLPEAAH
ncbi:MAG: hybrid sensor histidine kinase/response regulator, partial [Polaromonas sp.]|nr:hybrid sensor histidine kinase/response regulator [Polaromonas sp.]